MLLPRRPPGWPQPKVEYEPALNYDKDAAWLKEKLTQTGGYMYFSVGEAEPELYSLLEEDFRRARDENNADIYMVAGPVISIPASDGLRKRQEGRENLSPVVRLAKEGKILLYPTEKRLSHSFGLFLNTDTGSIKEPYVPGENPSKVRYVYNWWGEIAEYELLVNEARFSKKSVTKDFTESFLFLTDGEIAELRKSAARKNIDVNKIDIESCKEFWKEYTQ